MQLTPRRMRRLVFAEYIDEAWKTLSKNGLSAGASRDRLTFEPNMALALAKADFVQENGPERPDFKAKLFAEMDDATPPGSIIASSSSGITMDVIQSGCKRPERCVIGHPFNPPHVIPLVEVVGGAKTSPQTIEKAMAFYSSIGKKPIRLFKALPGHVANRLQAALYKEVLYLIQQGVLSVADADVAVSYGPGPRWGVMGPSLQWHLGGGPGGIPPFHGTHHGSYGDLDEGSRHPKHYAGTEADRRRRRDANGRQSLGRAACCRGERGPDRTPEQSCEAWPLTFALNNIENTTRRFVYEYDTFNNDQRRGC